MEIYPIPFVKETKDIPKMMNSSESKLLNYHQFPLYLDQYDIKISRLSFQKVKELVQEDLLNEILNYREQKINEIYNYIISNYEKQIIPIYYNNKANVKSLIDNNFEPSTDYNLLWKNFVKNDINVFNDSLSNQSMKDLITTITNGEVIEVNFDDYKINYENVKEKFSQLESILKKKLTREKIKEDLKLSGTLTEDKSEEIISFIYENLEKINELNEDFKNQIKNNKDKFEETEQKWQEQKNSVMLTLEKSRSDFEENEDKIKDSQDKIEDTKVYLDQVNKQRIEKQTELNMFNTNYYEYYNFIHTQEKSAGISLTNFLKSFSHSFKQFADKFVTSIYYEKIVYQDSTNYLFEVSDIKKVMPSLIGYRIISASRKNNQYKMNIAFKFHFTENEKIWLEIVEEKTAFDSQYKLSLINEKNSIISKWILIETDLSTVPRKQMKLSRHYSYPDLKQLELFFSLVTNNDSLIKLIGNNHKFYVKDLHKIRNQRSLQWDGEFVNVTDLLDHDIVNLLLIYNE